MKMNYDLLERTANFGEVIIEFVKNIKQTAISKPIILQLIRSGTSIGANYCEADNAESRKDFIHKIGICKKEASETKYWLRMISKVDSIYSNKARILWLEAKELTLIFNAIVNSTKNNKNIKN